MNEVNVEIYSEDCIPGIERLAPESINHCVTSIPFGALFSYSHKREDIGNNYDGLQVHEGQFGLHFRFFCEQLFRVMKPGSITSIHIQQLLRWKTQHGHMGMRDFRGAIITMFENHGFEPHGEVAIVKNPQGVARRLNLHSLMFATAYRDTRALAPAMNDYVLFFRKPGEGEPIHGIIEANRSLKLIEPSPILEYRFDTGFNGYAVKRVRPDWKDIPYQIERFDEKFDLSEIKTVKGGKHINPDGWFTKLDWIRWAHGCWTDIQEIDTLEGWKKCKENSEERHVCIAKDSMVLTDRGHVLIQNVEIGDRVLTHTGNWRRVLASQSTGINPTIRIYAQGVPGLRITPSHKVWSRNSRGLTRPKDVAKRAEPNWMEAQNLLGNFINMKLPPIEENNFGLSDSEWWLVGRWIADGHIDKRDVAHISCGYQKLSQIKSICGDILGNPRECRTSAQIPIKDPGRRIRGIIDFCGKGAVNKKLPFMAFVLPIKTAKCLLDGYLSGDGYFLADRNRWMISSVSKELLLGLQFIALRVYGAISAIHAGRPAGETVIENRVVKTKQEWAMSFQIGGYCFGFVENDGAWKKVKAIIPDEPCETWNLRVEKDESYTVDGCIVKNCPLQLEVIRRSIKLYSKPGDMVLDPFAGIGSTQYIAVEQGRHSVGFELKESYHQMALNNVAKARELFEQEKVNPQLELFSIAN